jgi:hypothetical protein
VNENLLSFKLFHKKNILVDFGIPPADGDRAFGADLTGPVAAVI